MSMRVHAADVHTHVWAPEHMSAEFMADLLRAWPEAEGIRADYEAHAAHAETVGRSVVLAFDAEHAGLVVPDEFVAEYVHRDDQRLVGFCSVDPLRRDVEGSLARATEELGLRGVKLAPTYQGFDPLSPEAFKLYEAIAKRDLPVMWHQGVTFLRKSVLAYALPRQIDEVALRFPEMRIVIAHLGHPWIDECLAVVRKNPNVYTDVSALVARPTQFRYALISAAEYRCGDKLLFGTDWPFSRTDQAIPLLAAWRDDPTAPPPLRQTAGHILSTDPLEVLGL
jgi:predicted TIM-barrel fold metal-dependent hydrolase